MLIAAVETNEASSEADVFSTGKISQIKEIAALTTLEESSCNPGSGCFWNAACTRSKSGKKSTYSIIVGTQNIGQTKEAQEGLFRGL